MANVRVNALPAATSLQGTDVLHGVADADDRDKQFSLSDLKSFTNSDIVLSIYGRTGAVTAQNGDYDLGEMGDVDLSTTPPLNGNFLKFNGTSWIPGNPVTSVASGAGLTGGPITTTGTLAVGAGTGITVNANDVAINRTTVDTWYAAAAHVGSTGAAHGAATTSVAGFMASSDKTKLDGIAAGAQVNVATNLSYTASTRLLASSTGTDVNLPEVVAAGDSGLMTGADKTKLDGIAAGAQVNVATNLGYTTAASTGTVTSSTGTNATLPAATTSLAGLLTGADKSKLNGIASGAQVNVPTDLTYTASTRLLASSTGTDVTLPEVVAAGNSGLMTGADKTKLNGIAAGAEVNVNADWDATSGDALILNKPTIPSGVTNLTYTTAASTGTVNSDTGTDATIPAATTSLAGLLTGADKTKLDGIAAGAQVNVATNLGYTTAASSGTVTSSTGTNATLPAATTSLAGLLTGADKTKLDGIAAGAQVNVATNLSNTPAASTVSVNSSTGTNTTIPAATASAAGVMTSADKSKLDGIAAGAEVNVNADWNATSGDALILNKPTIPSGVTNLSYTTAASTGTVNSSTGTNATIPAATTSVAGLLTSSDKSKLDGIAAGAQVNVATNLSNTPAASTLDVNSSTGNNTTLPAATTTAAGVMTSADKTKLDGIAAGAQVNVGTNLSYTGSTRVLASSTGTNATLPEVVAAGNSGLMTGADKTKLNGIAAGAEVNAVDSVFGRTGAVVAVDGDYDLGELGDVDLTTTPPSNGNLLQYDGTNWVPGSPSAASVNLGYTTAASQGTVTNDSGNDAVIPAATTSLAGLLTGTDKTKLDGIAAGAQVNVATNLSYTGSTRVLASSTGTNATLPEVVAAGNSGLMTGADKTKLDGIAAGAQVNVATNLAQGTRTTTTVPVTSSTGTDATLTAATTSLAGVMTSADKTKLDGIATGATANTGTVTSIATSGAITGGTITTSGTITARDATTGQTGVVQLSTSTSSTSTTLAATASAVKSANDNANGRLSTGGGTMTGGVYQTVRTISNNTAWDLSTGNLWTFAGGTIANPSNATAGLSGLIYVTAAISGWGTNFDHPGGTTLNPASFPAIIPFYVQATNVIKLGVPTEGIT